MDIVNYDDIESSDDFKTFTSTSKGPKGDLIKVVRFIPFNAVSYSHNLALGTLRGRNVDYAETTDNGDRDQILATIVQIAPIFINHYPNQKIFITGRNKATIRLYRAAINHAYTELVSMFEIYGGIYLEKENDYFFEEFDGTKQYEVFLFKMRGSIR
jgi:hypothetical protein